MIPHQSTKGRPTAGLPDATKSALQLTPPFAFKGLSARVFPLRASLNSLQQLCNSYYNVVPPEVGSFRAVVPYVYLMCLDYGQLSELITNVGWFAQREFFFCTPVEWYKVVNGKWIFHDWAVITPYIYVDDDLSAPLGREVYGWPKTIAHVVPSPSNWQQNPTEPDTLARVVTRVFPQLYGGLRLESRVFLEVERAAPLMNFQVPPRADSAFAPWVIATHLAQAIAGVGRDALGLAQAMRIFDPNPTPGTNPAFVAQMLERMGPAFAPGGPGFIANTLNLKQFRDAEDPTRLCYQALTNGQMQTTNFHGGGLLGEERILLGDVSGGYRISLYEYPSVSIAETLGLEVHQKWQENGAGMLSLKPVLPFWYNVDMTYLPGVNLAWRGGDGIWRDERGTALPSARNQAPGSDPPLFNTTVGSAIDEVAGPFDFRDTTIRVLPLLAHRETLTQFLEANINSAIKNAEGEQELRLSVWARPAIDIDAQTPNVEIGGDYAYVYMTASTFGAVQSMTNNVGDWIESELAFLIPVKLERRGTDGVWTLESVGLVPAYSFVPEIVAAISRVEVVGIPTLYADFPMPENAWMMTGGQALNAKQNLLTVNAEVIPALGEGQQARMHSLVQVSVKDYEPGRAELASRIVPVEWAEILRSELATKKSTKAQFPSECKIARALALELLGNQVPVSLYTLKEFRDVVDPNKACYQSLVRVSRRFDEVFDIREIEDTIRVRIHDYPTLNIAESLGIVAETIDEGDDHAGIIYAAQAIRPFYVRATVHEFLGERLVTRVGTLPVVFTDRSSSQLLSDNGPALTVDGAAETVQDQGDPCWMNSVMRQAADRRRVAPSDITKQAARVSLARVDPQMVIESMLSREWGNLDPNTRWRLGRRRVENEATLLLSGATPSQLAYAETLYANVPLGTLPHLKGIVTEMIVNMQKFTAFREIMETSFAYLATWVISMSPAAQAGNLDFKLPTQQHDPVEIAKAIAQLTTVLGCICDLGLLGDPSLTGLNPLAQDNHYQLGRLVNGPLTEVMTKVETANSADPAAWAAVMLSSSYAVGLFRDAVRLARSYCDAQRDALLNKLSRASQKPDFCIKRTSVGPERDLLLPISLSWDVNWYYGRTTDDLHARDAFPNVVTTMQGV